ncbi:hypothetical protein [Actinokineospora sp.]|uniref:hypothetical protein n=1 Tax=Actinokineospora sp. TaxID=1872133 RepID=UPI003D6B76BD
MDVVITVMNYMFPVFVLAFCVYLVIMNNKLRRELTQAMVEGHQGFAKRSLEVAYSLFENGHVKEAALFDDLAEKSEEFAARLQTKEPRGLVRRLQRGGLRADQHRR